eukprot:63229-Rhodomonas_salina.3
MAANGSVVAHVERSHPSCRTALSNVGLTGLGFGAIASGFRGSGCCSRVDARKGHALMVAVEGPDDETQYAAIPDTQYPDITDTRYPDIPDDYQTSSNLDPSSCSSDRPHPRTSLISVHLPPVETTPGQVLICPNLQLQRKKKQVLECTCESELGF